MVAVENVLPYFADAPVLVLDAVLGELQDNRRAWLVNRALDRKKVTPEVLAPGYQWPIDLALRYVTTYGGTFEPALSLQTSARKWGRLTPHQSIFALNLILAAIRHQIAPVEPKPEKAVILPEPGVYTVLVGSERRTLRLLPTKNNMALSVGYLSGPNNEADYTRFAWVDTSGAIRPVARIRAEVLVFTALRAITGGGSGVVLVAAHCKRCGKRLTVPKSLYNGYGPECIKKIGG